VQGNVAKLIKLARSPYPLPLAGLDAKHSLLGLDNLVEAVDKVLAAPISLKRPLIVADPEPLTIGAIVAALRQGLGRRARLFYVPKPMLAAALRAAGQTESYKPLFGSLVADPSALARLHWTPRVATQHGLASLVRDEPDART
jgi:UDP-glucose 4-epimerase